MVSVSECLNAISDDKSLLLFNTIGLGSQDTSILISRLGLTRKQYYSRLSGMINSGLIGKKNGKYSITSLGKVVYEAQVLIGKGVQYSSKLVAIDSIEKSEIPVEQRNKIIDALVIDSKIKEILSSHPHNNNKLVSSERKELTLSVCSLSK